MKFLGLTVSAFALLALQGCTPMDVDPTEKGEANCSVQDSKNRFWQKNGYSIRDACRRALDECRQWHFRNGGNPNQCKVLSEQGRHHHNVQPNDQPDERHHHKHHHKDHHKEDHHRHHNNPEFPPIPPLNEPRPAVGPGPVING